MMNGVRCMLLSIAASAGCSAPAESAQPVQPRASVAAPAERHTAASRGHVCVIVPRDVVTLHAPQSGWVVDVHGRVNDHVKVGDALLALESGLARDALVVSTRRLQAGQADLDVARIEEARSQGELVRVEQLFREGVASHRELSDVSSRAHAARLHVARALAVLEARQAELASSRRQVEATVLRAPVQGRIASMTARPGSSVLPGTLLVRLISDETPMARCAVPSALAVALLKGTAARLNMADTGAVDAQVRRIAPEVDPISQLVIVELDVSAARPLLPGTAAWMHWPSS